jgi:hypothetical protein
MNFAARSDPLERTQLQLSRLYLNSQIGHHMNLWWQKRSRDIYGDGGTRGDQNVIELKTLKEKTLRPAVRHNRCNRRLNKP